MALNDQRSGTRDSREPLEIEVGVFHKAAVVGKGGEKFGEINHKVKYEISADKLGRK